MREVSTEFPVFCSPTVFRKGNIVLKLLLCWLGCREVLGNPTFFPGAGNCELGLWYVVTYILARISPEPRPTHQMDPSLMTFFAPCLWGARLRTRRSSQYPSGRSNASSHSRLSHIPLFLSSSRLWVTA